MATALNAQGTIHYAGIQDPKYDFETSVDVPISGNLNVRGGANVWVMEGAFLLDSRIKAKGMLALTTETKDPKAQVDLVFYHDGIWAEVFVDSSFNLNSNRDDKDKKEDTSKNGFRGGGIGGSKPTSSSPPQKWQWVEAQKKNTSPYRVTVIG
ncbi:hypothetical protein ROW45_000041 [Vibrio fluvialis]|nr:hypothetical protein [Vibrio fluvialis]